MKLPTNYSTRSDSDNSDRAVSVPRRGASESLTRRNAPFVLLSVGVALVLGTAGCASSTANTKAPTGEAPTGGTTEKPASPATSATEEIASLGAPNATGPAFANDRRTFSFVYTIEDKQYILLQNVTGTSPRFSSPKLFESSGTFYGAVAELDPADLSKEILSWQNQTVELNSGSKYKIKKLALVELGHGELEYSPLFDREPQAPAASKLFISGKPIIAGELDRECVLQRYPDTRSKGDKPSESGERCDEIWARLASDDEKPATLPKTLFPSEVKDANLAATVASKLLHSGSADPAKDYWSEEGDGQPWPPSIDRNGRFFQKVLEYSDTDTNGQPRQTIAVHAGIFDGCGAELVVNLIGIYHVVTSGNLTTAIEGNASSVMTYIAAVDIDGDGILEWIGETMNDKLAIMTGAGEILYSVPVPVYMDKC